MVCRDQVLLADFTKEGVNGAYTHATDLVTHMKLMSGLALALLLTACGGGGGASSAVNPVTNGGGGTSGGGSSGGGTVENVRIGLVFNSINLEYETTYAQLTPSNANSVSAWRTVLDSYVALLGNAISSVLVPNAVALTPALSAIDSSEASEISKLFLTQRFSLSIQTSLSLSWTKMVIQCLTKTETPK